MAKFLTPEILFFVIRTSGKDCQNGKRQKGRRQRLAVAFSCDCRIVAAFFIPGIAAESVWRRSMTAVLIHGADGGEVFDRGNKSVRALVGVGHDIRLDKGELRPVRPQFLNVVAGALGGRNGHGGVGRFADLRGDDITKGVICPVSAACAVFSTVFLRFFEGDESPRKMVAENITIRNVHRIGSIFRIVFSFLKRESGLSTYSLSFPTAFQSSASYSGFRSILGPDL